jgi:hypothetical protein
MSHPGPSAAEIVLCDGERAELARRVSAAMSGISRPGGSVPLLVDSAAGTTPRW